MHRVGCCAPPHHPNTPAHRPSTPFNLHRARVRRNHGGFLQVVVSKTRNHTKLAHPLASSRLRYISNDAGRVKSFCFGFSIVLAHHNLLRNLHSCLADDSPQLPIFIHVQPTSLGPVSLHRFGVAPPNISSVTMRTTMIYSNSLRFREAGSPFNTPVTAEQDHLSARHSRTGITTFLPQLSAAAEFLVVNLIAQHDPESDPEFASGGGLCFPSPFCISLRR